MRFKRSERIVYMTQYLLKHPNELVPLTYFVNHFGQAKSSISEDIQIIKETFQAEGLGIIETTAGASGGVTYRPKMYKKEAIELIEDLCELLKERERLLPGGYLFMSDLVGNPKLLNQVGELIATMYMDEELDAVVTIATKGISLANAVAKVLNLPVVVIRKDNKVTENVKIKNTEDFKPKKGDFVKLISNDDGKTYYKKDIVDHDDIPHGLMMKIHEMDMDMDM